MPNNTEHAFSFKTNKSKFANITKRHVMTLISLGKGINGEKNTASEEQLHIEFLKQLNTHEPSANIILVAGLLKRWNFWEMIQEVSDDELARRLYDVPKDINEEKLAPLLAAKFSDIAAVMEQKYIQQIGNYLQESKEALRDIVFPFKIIPWNQRENLDNFAKKLSDTKNHDENSESQKFIETTVQRFLNNKQIYLDMAKERLTKVLPQLTKLDFEKLVNYACRQYILEEYAYFANLKNFEVFYNGSIPALNPILKDKNNNLHWHSYNFQPTKKLQEEFHITDPSTEKKTSSPLSPMRLDEFKLTGNRSILFPRIKSSTELKEPTTAFIDTSELSPRSSKRMKLFFEHYLNNLTSKTKELADRKIEEVTTFLSMG